MGAKITAGFRSEDAPALDYWLPYDPSHHEVLRYLDLLRLLGAEASDFRTYLPVLPSDEEQLSSLEGLIDAQALNQGRYMGLHASAGVPSRRWSTRRFAWVADHLLEEFDLEGVLVTAGPGQEGDSTSVVEAMRHRDRAVNLGGKTSLGALVALINRLNFFMSNDSGPSHMARALGVPSLAVFGPANPVNWGPLDRTWHRLVAVWDTPCRWMPDDGCPNSPDVQCLLSISPEAVLAEARQLLGQVERMRAPLRAGEREARRSTPRKQAA